MAGSAYVEPHTPALGTVDPATVSHAAAVHSAAEQAALGLREHYHQNILGQGANAGDPQSAASTLTPPEINMRDGDMAPGPASAL